MTEDSELFSIEGIPLHTFVEVSSESPSTVRTVYLVKPCLGKTCRISSENTILNGYLNYRFIVSTLVGTLGVVFYTYKALTKVQPFCLSVNKGEDNDFYSDFKLEKIGLYAYLAANGAAVVIGTNQPKSNLIVEVC